jgi:hypothetical protein
MLGFGEALAEDVKDRILRAEDAYDNPAPPLKPNYAKVKQRKYPPAIRNLQFTGRTLRGLRCLEASENKAVVGFSDPVAAQRIAINNRRVGVPRQFGASPKNMENIRRVIATARFVRASSVAA